MNPYLLMHDIHNIPWNLDDINSSEVNLMFDDFYSKLSATIDKHAPLKQLSKKDIKYLSNPWISAGIKTSIKIKNNLYKKYVKTKSLYYHTKFKIYRNKLNHLIKISKTEYYNRYFTTHSANIKSVWKGIRQIISFKPMSNIACLLRYLEIVMRSQTVKPLLMPSMTFSPILAII